MHIGFSTGSIAKGDFKLALKILAQQDTESIELSALREEELLPLCESIKNLDLTGYKYISVHAPSKRLRYSEVELVNALSCFAERNWPVIVHPDIIEDFRLWTMLGENLCIENMDKRKPAGRTAADLRRIFQLVPDAGFCLDLAHAKQVDATMTECYLMIKEFGHRLTQLHISDVTSESRHVPLNEQAIDTFHKIVQFLPLSLPVILESPILPGPDQNQKIAHEILMASEIFKHNTSLVFE